MKKLLLLLIFMSACFVTINAQTTDSHTKIADEWPMFPGCEDLDGTKAEIKLCADRALMKYIYSDLQYPAIARANKIEGLVIISFQLDENGKISDPKISRDIGAGCGEAALKVVQKMISENLNFVPAKLEGKNVSMEFSLPFKFNIQ